MEEKVKTLSMEIWKGKGKKTQEGWQQTVLEADSEEKKKKAKLQWDASVAATSEEGMEKLYSLEKYKDWVIISEVIKHKSSGNEIIINLYNHFVRFESFYDVGFIEDDPGNQTRTNNKVSWSEARKNGYFRKYTVIKP